MKLINAHGVYSFILTEDEWYLATGQQRQAWVVQCEREATEAGAKYATILVDPDAVMSISPFAERHKVWGTAFQVDNAETKFRDALLNLLCEHERNLSVSDICALARKVISEYAK